MRIHAGVAALLALAALSCGKPKPGDTGSGGTGGTPSNQCTTTADCQGGMVCKDGSCAACAMDIDCPDIRQTCSPITLTCQYRDGSGNECKVHEDCPLGNFCVQGLCVGAESVTFCGRLNQCPATKRCNRPLDVCEEDLGCRTAADCDTGEGCNVGTGKCQLTCTEDPTVCTSEEHCAATGLCVQCEKDGDCTGGLSCNLDAGLCVAEGICYRDATCPAGQICNLSTHTCIVTPPPCNTDNDCSYDQKCDVPSGKCLSRTCGDLYEPNNTRETATPIVGSTVGGLFLCPGDEDWFSFDLSANDLISVNISYDVLSSGGIMAELQDGQGRVLRSDPYTVTTTVPAPGTYYLHIYSTVATQSTQYDLTIIKARGMPCQDDVYDSGGSGNHDVRHAVVLSSGVYHALMYCTAAPDFFQVAVPVGKSISVEMNYDPTQGGGLDLLLYDSDGKTLLAQDRSTSTTESVSATHASSGVAFVEVTAPTEGTQNPYDLAITVQ